MVSETKDYVGPTLTTEERAVLVETTKIIASLDHVPAEVGKEVSIFETWYEHNKDFIILCLVSVIAVGAVLFNHYVLSPIK